MNKFRKTSLILILLICSSIHYAYAQTGCNTNTDQIIRVLAIGNSFSEDAIESHLHDIAKAADVKVIIGNLYIPGCTLERHWNNAQSGEGAYAYRKIGLDGIKIEIKNTTLLDGIEDEEWDYISLQQVSGLSGMIDSYSAHLPLLYTYVDSKKRKESGEIILHQTWAYATTSTHPDFSKYNNNQMKMYTEIVNAAWRAAEMVGISTIVPVGTAIQNGRTSFIGDNFCRDGYHLDAGIGKYTAACTWFEKLTGKSVIGNNYKPDELAIEEIKVAQLAAHNAIANPKGITESIYKHSMTLIEAE